MKANCYWLWLLSLVLMGCMEKNMTVGELLKWVKDPENGLHKHKIVGDIEYDVVIIPDELTNRKKEKDSLIHCQLAISVRQSAEDIISYGVEGEAGYNENLYYYQFRFENDIFLEDGEKRLPCVLYHFERSYDLKSERVFDFSFEDTGSNLDKTIVIDSKKIGVGEVKIKIRNKDLKELDRIKLKL